MPAFGKLDECNETEDWRHYIERVNHFFEANEITDPDKRRSIFLVCVGAKTYKLVRSLVAQLFEEGLETLQSNPKNPSLQKIHPKSMLTPRLPLSSIKPDQYRMLLGRRLNKT